MRDPVINEIIKCFALFQNPAQVEKSLKEKFGDNAPNYYTIAKARSQYRFEILEKRNDLEAQLPILSAEERWGYLQGILDDALTEKPIVLKGKMVGVTKDLKSALEAIKVANNMSETKGSVQPENEAAIRQTVMEAYDALKEAKPRADEQELIESLLKGLGNKYQPFIEELREDGQSNFTESQAQAT